MYRKNITDLQEQGFISKLKITLLDIFDETVEKDRNCLFNVNSNRKYRPDEDGQSDIMFNEAYNAELEYYKKYYIDLYTPMLKYIGGLDENTMILFDRIEIGQSLFELSKTILPNKNPMYIDGSTKVEDREAVRARMEKNGGNVLFGNVSVVGTGTNIKRLNHIVFVINTKSQSRILQAIGRALRLHQFKDVAHLVDVRMNFKYSTKHFAERMRFYKNCYGKQRVDEIIKVKI